MVKRFGSCCLSTLFVLILFCSAHAQSKPTDQGESLADFFGVETEFVEVYRKNHPNGRATKSMALKSNRSTENYTWLEKVRHPIIRKLYAYLLDDVQLMTFPNSNFAKKKPAVVEKDEVT